MQRLDRAGHRQIGLARARRTDAEGQVVAADVVQIFRLVGPRARTAPRIVRTFNSSARPARVASVSLPVHADSWSAICTRSESTGSRFARAYRPWRTASAPFMAAGEPMIWNRLPRRRTSTPSRDSI